VPDLIWKKGAEIILNSQAMEQDIDKLGYPSWSLIHLELYPESQHGAFFRCPIAPMITTRAQFVN
jgi:hypothetical protein